MEVTTWPTCAAYGPNLVPISGFGVPTWGTEELWTFEKNMTFEQDVKSEKCEGYQEILKNKTQCYLDPYV